MLEIIFILQAVDGNVLIIFQIGRHNRYKLIKKIKKINPSLHHYTYLHLGLKTPLTSYSERGITRHFIKINVQME